MKKIRLCILAVVGLLLASCLFAGDVRISAKSTLNYSIWDVVLSWFN